MRKEDILNELNTELQSNIDATNSMYRGKVYILSSNSKIEGYYKTKRGAEGYIKKNKDICYYDDYLEELIYPNRALAITEIKASEIVDIETNKEIWKICFNRIKNDKFRYDTFEYVAKENLKNNSKLLDYVLGLLQDVKNNKKEYKKTDSINTKYTKEKIENNNFKIIIETEDDEETEFNNFQVAESYLISKSKNDNYYDYYDSVLITIVTNNKELMSERIFAFNYKNNLKNNGLKELLIKKIDENINYNTTCLECNDETKECVKENNKIKDILINIDKIDQMIA